MACLHRPGMGDTQDVRLRDHVNFSLLIQPLVGAQQKIEHHAGCLYILSNVSGIEKMSRGSG